MTANAVIAQTKTKPKFTYGKMFNLPAFRPPGKELILLGMGMHSASPQKRSTMPAGYVFLGQFIDHDLAHDTLSQGFPYGELNPLELENAREPFFTLDVLYGDGPGSKDSHLYESRSALLKLSDTVPAAQDLRKFPNDLPRKGQFAGVPPTAREFQEALVVDNRQDENLAIAQTHVAFIKFHNAVARNEFGGKGSFKKIKELVVKHYQDIVLNDFLPRIVDPDILREVIKDIKNGKQRFRPDATRPIMPVEFSVGAFRMGHSIVTEEFDWNRHFTKVSIQDLSDFTARGRMQGETIWDNITEKRIPAPSIPSDWIIDWTRFYDFGGMYNSAKSKNFAAKIDTSMIERFKTLVPGDDHRFDTYESSLAVRNLFRGRRHMLPSGQAVAKLFGESVIDKDSITKNMEGSGLKKAFGIETPLWYYILREAELTANNKDGTERLGRVGSRIMCEAMLGLMRISPISIFNDPTWRPSLFRGPSKATYSMPDLLNYVGDLNPLAETARTGY